MRITIHYEASWRNTFLDGSNNFPIPKRGRGFIGSMIKLSERNPEGRHANFKCCEITHDTVMGILNRLIGDQRKLYQSRKNPSYFFEDIESSIHFEDLTDRMVVNNEMIYIRNITGSTDQNAFTGAIKANAPIFTSDYSSELWGVLSLDFETLCQFILQPNRRVASEKMFSPVSTLEQLECLNKLKAMSPEGLTFQALLLLQSTFPDQEYLHKDKIKPIAFYCSALYLQVARLQSRFDLLGELTRSGGLPGISKRGFTPKDFMAKFTTGEKKRIWGNPYILKQKIKGQGEVVSMLTKASGVLDIRLDIPRDKAIELKEMIEAAGVSSFYIGKKGLAYVTELRI